MRNYAKLNAIPSTIFILLLSFLSITKSYSQTETRNKIWIPANTNITKIVKVKDCQHKVNSGDIVKKEYTKKNGSITYTVTNIDTVEGIDSFKIEKEIRIPIRNLSGYANLEVNTDKESELLVNYWLNGQDKVLKGQRIRIVKRTLKCPIGKKVNPSSDYFEKDTIYTLEKDTIFHLWKVSDNSRFKQVGKLKKFKKEKGWYLKKDWFQHSNIRIEVMSKDTTDTKVDYYLVNKYDSEAKYVLSLKNREFISYAKKNIEFGPLTIPFKQRFGYKVNDSLSVNPSFEGNLNVGLFFGYKFGKYRVRLEGKKIKKLSNISATLGAFTTISAVTLNKSNTTTGMNPYEDEEERTIGSLSIGLGFMLDVYNVNIGLFAGWDIGFGHEAENWDHHVNPRPWLGIGFGYNLNGLWRK